MHRKTEFGRHTFVGMRHGISQANEQALIVSDPEVGCDAYGLSERGHDALRNAAQSRVASLFECAAGRPIEIHTSDFRRTRETAEIMVEVISRELGQDFGVTSTALLRERFFGDFDLTTNANYGKVWARDEEDASHTDWNVESVTGVADRMRGYIRHLAATPEPTCFLIVSHGDPLHILTSSLLDRSLGLHRQLTEYAPGDMRDLFG